MIKNKFKKNKHVSFSRSARVNIYNQLSSIPNLSYLNKVPLGNLEKDYKGIKKSMAFPLNTPTFEVDTETASEDTFIPKVDKVFPQIDPTLFPIEIYDTQSLKNDNTTMSHETSRIPSSIKLSDNLSESVSQTLQTSYKDNSVGNDTTTKIINIDSIDEKFDEKEELYKGSFTNIYNLIQLIFLKFPVDDNKPRSIFTLLENIEKSHVASEKKTMLNELKTTLLDIPKVSSWSSKNLKNSDATDYVIHTCNLIDLKISNYEKVEKLISYQHIIINLCYSFKSLINEYMYIDLFTALSIEKIKLLKDKNIIDLNAYTDLCSEFKPFYNKLSRLKENIELCKKIHIKLSNISDLLEDLTIAFDPEKVRSIRELIYKLRHHRKLLHFCMETKSYEDSPLNNSPESEFSKYRGSSVDAKYPLTLLLDEINRPDFNSKIPIEKEIFKKTYNKYMQAEYRESFLIKKLIITVSEIDSILTKK